MMLARGLHGRHRLIRPVWRMCLATFIATGSFFLGQAKVFPKRVWFMQRYPRRLLDAFEPTPRETFV